VTTNKIFCSDYGLNGDEPIEGSAPSFPGFIFLSWPRIYWEKFQFNSEGLPTSLVEYLKALQTRTGHVTRLFNPPTRDTSNLTVIAYPENRIAKHVPIDSIVDIVEKMVTGIDDPLVKHDDVTRLFVCTHGVRDRCCAKFGAAAASEARDAQKAVSVEGAFEVYETTHLGGDRFAATAIAFPSGHMYGRIRFGDATQIVRHEISGGVYSPCYRGLVYLSGIRQLAEARGQKMLFDENVTGKLDVSDCVLGNDGEKEVSLSIASDSELSGVYRITAIRKKYKLFLDCDQVDRSEVGEAARWVVSTVAREDTSEIGDHG